MKTITEKRTLAANGCELAERLLLITGYRAEVSFTIWGDEEPGDERHPEDLTFPDKHEDCWFSILGDNSMGSIVDIFNNEEGHLIVTAHFGDDGPIDFNLHTEEFLNIQKIVSV